MSSHTPPIVPHVLYVAQYAELVERVRAHLGDDTDYSQE